MGDDRADAWQVEGGAAGDGVVSVAVHGLVCYLMAMADKKPVELKVHVACDSETGRWYVSESEVPGLNLDAIDAPRLIRKIMVAAPELLELNAAEVQKLYGILPGAAVRLTPVFDSPLAIAA